MEQTERLIIHVDMDAFYAAIEQLDHREYRNKPVVVGALPRGGKGRGVVSAASYEARKHGIHSAMPISSAYRLCPHAVYVLPRIERYAEVSERIMEILSEFSPLVEQISIDEAFLDCTGTTTLFGPPRTLAHKMKERIKEETELTCSIGMASNKSIAKIASELSKPDGLLLCPFGEERRFLANLPLSFLWGAGKKTVETLKRQGFKTVGDVASSSKDFLLRILGKNGMHLWLLANGIDERPVTRSGLRKSISEEITFERDVASDRVIEHTLFGISDRLTRRMRGLKIKGKTITLKIRLQNFETFTRSQTLSHGVNDMSSVRTRAVELFRSFNRNGKKVRLVGISISQLGSNLIDAEQPGLFQERETSAYGTDEKRAMTSEALLDMMKQRYGEKVTRASCLPSRDHREKSTHGKKLS